MNLSRRRDQAKDLTDRSIIGRTAGSHPLIVRYCRHRPGRFGGFLHFTIPEVCLSRSKCELQRQAEFQVDLRQRPNSLSVRILLRALVHFHELAPNEVSEADELEKKIDKRCRRKKPIK